MNTKDQLPVALADLGGRARRTLPMGPNSFVFAYIFTEKCPRQRSTPPLREILDPPLCCYLRMRPFTDLQLKAAEP